jgi:CheY-like chemotaxis protein
MRALLRDVLERGGFHVHEHSAGDGLLLEDWIPDAIVLDKEMAGSNGLELLPEVASPSARRRSSSPTRTSRGKSTRSWPSARRSGTASWWAAPAVGGFRTRR